MSRIYLLPKHIATGTSTGPRSIRYRFPSRYLYLLLTFLLITGLILLRPSSGQLLERRVRWTPAFFPPAKRKTADACTTFPKHLLDRVQVVVKSGIAESSRTRSQLTTILSCVEDALIFSDVDQTIYGTQIRDVLELEQPWSRKDTWAPKFHKGQREEFARTGQVEKSPEGWKLDKYKFLPMLERTWELRPGKDWYVFWETDTYVFWDTLFRLLSLYDPVEPRLLGSVIGGSHGRVFPYGGAAYIISYGLMEKMFNPVKRYPRLSEKYADWVVDDCCGDAVLGYAIHDRAHVSVQQLNPIMSGEELGQLGTNAQTWCTPILSLHRTSVSDNSALWAWERSRPFTEDTMTYSSLLGFGLSDIAERDRKTNWDNHSDRKQRGSYTIEQCAESCVKSKKCLQWSFLSKTCKHGNAIKIGGAIKTEQAGMVSGWDRAKLHKLGWNGDAEFMHTCGNATWPVN